jgi:thiamine-phosphate pyrophosphorylase
VTARPCPGLVAASDEARLAQPDALDRIVALARAGCPAILLRPGGMPARAFYNLARDALPVCAAGGAELWIGDRTDVALATGADGVQLPARGLSLEGARRVVGGKIRIGRSVHSPEAAARAAAEGADHVILGPVFATASHPRVAPGGPALVAAARAAMEARGRGVPILAIGGITPATAPAAIEAGAWGVAALSALWDAPDPAAAVGAFRVALGGER